MSDTPGAFFPKGDCISWDPFLLWMNVVSDAVTALAFLSIPFALIYFVRKQKYLSFRWLYILFIIFILLGGVLHLLDIYTIWVPNYALEGFFKAATAVVSLATAVLIWPAIPKALKIPTPEVLEAKNRELHALTQELEARVEARTRDSAQLAAIVNQSGDAIFSRDLEGRILTWNKGAEKVFQYAADEIIGKPVTSFIPPQFRAEYERLNDRVKNGHHVPPFETVRTRKDGSKVDVFVSLSPIRDKDGSVIGASGIASDISIRKQLDRDLKFTSRQLEETNHKLLKAHKAKDDFIANLSHELRNPLNIVLGYSELLSDMEPGSEEYQHALLTIKKNARTQLHLIEDLLDISRIVSGKISFQLQPSDIKEILRNAIEVVRPSAEAKSIKIRTQLTLLGGQIVCDPDRLQQVLWNLLSNAVKFTPEQGEVTARISERKDKFIIEIEDTGEGIKPKDLPRLFDRHYQGEGSATTTGLGLGLNITKDLVEAHGGEIRALSQGRGRGSTFIVELPTVAKSKNGVKDAPLPETKAGQLSHRNILVFGSRKLKVSQELEEAGAKIFRINSRRKAFELIQQQKIDCVITEIKPHNEDSFVFMSEMRKFETENMQSHLPSVAIIDKNQENVGKKSEDSGFDLVIPSPISGYKLIEEISKLTQFSA